MTDPIHLIAGLSGLLALLYWLGFCHRGQSTAKSAIKTLSVLGLLAMAALWGGAVLLLLALALCALGDYLLSRDSEVQFMAGVGAFAAGHLAYVALFLTHPLADPARIAAQPVLIAGLVLFGAVMAGLLWPRAGDLRGPVMVYIPVILSMGLAVMALPVSGAQWLAPLAAALFIASDFTLSVEMFVLLDGPLKRLAPFIVWPTYWGAQACFVLAFAAPLS